jgi:pyruvate formate lyase activating enzyme
MAKDLHCQGISWTYNEPALWLEYVLDGAKLAKEAGLLTNIVTNGYMTPRALDLLGHYLDAYRVDVKAFSRESYRQLANVEDWVPILKTTSRAKRKWGIHVEVITNIVPGHNDDHQQLTAIARWIFRELGVDTPWHVTRFFPHRGLSDLPPTPVSVLERARQIGLGIGLRYIYLGNVPGHTAENTYCPDCRTLLVERRGGQILTYAIEAGCCPSCGQKIPIVGRFIGDEGGS